MNRSFSIFPILPIVAAAAGLVVLLGGCGGYYVKQKVERPALVALPEEVKTFELVDVHLAGEPDTLPELLSYRSRVLPHLRRDAKRILGRDAEMHPSMIAAVPPIADAFKSCVSTDLNLNLNLNSGGNAASGKKPSWKLAVFVSDHSTSPASLLAPILATKSYMVTVRLALWDAENRLVDRTTITFTKSEDGGENAHYSFPPDDDDLNGGSLDSFGEWKVDDPLWLRGVVSALDLYLRNLRTSRKEAFVRKGESYSEPPERVTYRKAHIERAPATLCH